MKSAIVILAFAITAGAQSVSDGPGVATSAAQPESPTPGQPSGQPSELKVSGGARRRAVGSLRAEGGITFSAVQNGHYLDRRAGAYVRVERSGRWGAVGEFSVDPLTTKQFGRTARTTGEIQIRRRIGESPNYLLGGAQISHVTAFGGKTGFGPEAGFGHSQGDWDATLVASFDMASENRTKAIRFDLGRRFPLKGEWFWSLRGSVSGFVFKEPYNPGGPGVGGGVQVKVGIGR